MKKRHLIAFLLIILFQNQVISQIKISGQIKDEKNNPVEFIEIQLQNKDSIIFKSELTNADGKFILETEKGEYSLLIRQLGVIYHKQKINVTQDTYIGIINITEKVKELQEILVKNNLLENGKINFEKPVQDSVATEIAQKFQFLYERKESQFLLSYISPKSTPEIEKIFKTEKYFIYSKINSSFKNVKYSKDIKNGEKYTQLNIRANSFNYSIKGYDQIIKIYNYDNENFSYEGNTFSLKGFNGDLTLYFNGNAIDLSPEIQKIINTYKNQQGEVYTDQISFVKQVGNYELKFLLEGISKNQYQGERDTYYISDDVIILLKKK